MSDAPKTSGMTRLRNYFLTGFIVCAPLAITAYIAWSFIGWVDSWVKPYIPARYSPDTYLPFPVPGFGLIVALILIPTIGFLTYVLKSDIVPLDMTIEDGAKLIVSAGLVAPEVKTKLVTLNGEPINGTLANPPLGPHPARRSRTASSRPNK